MQLHLIWAQARHRVIGLNGVMPWHLPEDLAHFKQHTQGCPVIMGRKTWESLPPRFRPLPGRRNIVITRQSDWVAGGAEIAGSLQVALDACSGTDTVWVIGGAQIYAQALPLAQRVVMTQIDAEYAGDAHAPELGPEWREVSRSSHENAQGLKYSFVTFDRQPL
jgi:dihydrofolate reductase